MRPVATALTSGLLFGAGLVLSGMTLPDRVVGFLDVTGDWDPSLAFVMFGAIAVHALAYRVQARLKGPFAGGTWALPTRSDIDRPLLIGAALFGAGWGLGGYCPGPALTASAAGAAPTLQFTGAMVAGMALHDAWQRYRASHPAPQGP